MSNVTTPATAIRDVFPYIRVRGGVAAIDFYTRAFGAKGIFRLNEPGSHRVGHAEIRIGTTVLMLSDEYPEMGIAGPQSVGGTTFAMHLHVDNADAWVQRAVDAGATVVRPVHDEFYGERGGTIRDPFGHEWMIGHEIEKVTPEEMQRRWNAMAEDCK